MPFLFWVAIRNWPWSEEGPGEGSLGGVRSTEGHPQRVLCVTPVWCWEPLCCAGDPRVVLGLGGYLQLQSMARGGALSPGIKLINQGEEVVLDWVLGGFFANL